MTNEITSKILLRVDSRDLEHHLTLGATTIFPDTINFDDGLTNIIEAPNDVDCTAISTCDVCGDQTKQVYDVDDLWAQVPKSALGADPRDTMSITIKNGLLRKGTNVRDISWTSYFRGDTDKTQIDAFDSVRSAMLVSQSSITVGSNWYANWNQVSPNGIMPQGDRVVSGHDYKICGWGIISGSLMFKIKAWQGYTTWMPRGVFNYTIGQLGCGTYMPSTTAITEKRKRTLQQWLLDSIQNLLLIFRQMYTQIYGKLFK